MSLRRPNRSPIALFALLALTAGCGDDDETTTAAPRITRGILPGLPVAPSACTSAPCLCADYPSAYEASAQAYHPINYAGDGPRSVAITGSSADQIHIWPATACGDSMAARAVDFACPICINYDRDTEPDMLTRTITLWPSPLDYRATFQARTGLAYYAYQEGRIPVRFDGAAVTVALEQTVR